MLGEILGLSLGNIISQTFYFYTSSCYVMLLLLFSKTKVGDALLHLHIKGEYIKLYVGLQTKKLWAGVALLISQLAEHQSVCSTRSHM